MGRKGYPFSKKDCDKGCNLVSCIIASIICLPFLLGSSSNDDFSLEDYENSCGIRTFFPKFFLNITPNIVLNILSIIPPILGLYFFRLGWWMFFSILVFGLLDILVYMIFVGSTKFYLEEICVFNRNEVSKQIQKVKTITYIDTSILFIHIVIYLLFYYYSYLLVTDTNIISYLLVLIVIIMYVTPLFINSILTCKTLKSIIQKNKSYITIVQEREIISLEMLYELCDNRNENFQFTLMNGMTLKIINKKSLDIHQSGFLLCQVDNNNSFFCFDKYSKSFSDFLKNNNQILENILQDINYKIISHQTHKNKETLEKDKV